MVVGASDLRLHYLCILPSRGPPKIESLLYSSLNVIGKSNMELYYSCNRDSDPFSLVVVGKMPALGLQCLFL